MPAEPDFLALAAEFRTATRADWRALAARALERRDGELDADPERALSHTTYDGIPIAPLYTAADVADLPFPGTPGSAPFVRGAHPVAATPARWDVRVRHADPDPAAATEALLADVEHGATSVWLVVGDRGMPVDRIGDALANVRLDEIAIVLDAGNDWERAAQHVLAAAQRPALLRGSLGLDPIGSRARTGGDADLGALAAAARLVPPESALHVATVDGAVYHDAGASDAQELGIATAVGVAYLRALTDDGMSIDDALRRMEFRWAVSADQFASIAKLRAARQIWSRVAELCNASDALGGQRQHAVTSNAMLTRRDPWVNMLRSTIACFAAAIGGAEAITVAPFDSVIGMSDDFARRIARNTHPVLHDESSLARVVDAAGGSWFVETLTQHLADAAWTVFTDIEKNGGPLARLNDGTIADFIARTRQARNDDIAQGRMPITGVTEYANPDEQPIVRPASPTMPPGLLPTVRYAEPFEAATSS